MQATGKSLENLETVKDFLFVSDGKQYEEFDWRDPFVFGMTKTNAIICCWRQE